MKRFSGVVALMGATVLFGGVAQAKPLSAAASAKPAVSSSPQVVQTILAQSKAAMGGAAWDNIHSLRVEGTLKIGELSGSIGSLHDLSSGHWVGHGAIGPIKQSSGFDGKAAWKMGSNGNLTTHAPLTASDVASIYRNAYAWWYPKRWPAEITLIGPRGSQGKTFTVLRITPRDGAPFELWINARTHFIARFVDATDGDSITTVLGDYRAVHGVELPFRKQVINQTKRRQQLTQIQTASVNVPVSASDFAAPQPRQDSSVTGGSDKVTLPFQFTNGYIYFPVKINGHSFRFLLDTGGPNVMSARAARALGIVGKGSVAAAGLGSGHVMRSYAKVKRLTLDDKLTLRDQTFAIQPMHDADGTIGSDLLYAFVLRIDYAAHELTLVRPAAFNAAAAGTPLPIQVRQEKPFVQASIGGVPGWFLMDTGANVFMTLNTPFATKHDLYARFHAAPPSAAGHGYNGQIIARMAHDQKFEMGSFQAQLPEFMLSTETTGIDAEEHMAGFIGSGILRSLTLTIDYANSTVYLKPNQT